MDPAIQRALNEKLYEKRKVGALECVSSPVPFVDRPRLYSVRYLCLLTFRFISLERSIRELVAVKDTVAVEAILDQLCNEYAYAVHQHSRNGGLIGLAAAAIALGPVRCVLLPPSSPQLSSRLLTARVPLGIASVPRNDRTACSGLLRGPRCPCAVLCLRGHVQHCQGGQRRDPDIL